MRHRSYRRKLRLAFESLETRHLLAADLIAHWHAADLSGSNGEHVATWIDRHAGIPAVAVGQPRISLDPLIGRNTVRFDAADGDDGFRIDQRVSPMSGIGDFSIVVVFATAATDLAGHQGPWFESTALVDASNLGLAQDWGLGLNAAGQAVGGIGAGFARPTHTVYSSVGNLNDGQLHAVSWTRTGADLALHVDEHPASTYPSATDQPRAQEIDMTLGVRETGGFALTGSIAEIRIYRGALQAAEIIPLHDLLRNAANAPPRAVVDRYQVAEDTALVVTASQGLLANDQDPDNNPLVVQSVSPPTHGSLEWTPDGAITYVPNADYVGFDLFSYRVSDGLSSSEPALVMLTINSVNDPPLARPDRYVALADSSLVVSVDQGVLANDTDPDGPARQTRVTVPPTNGVLELADDGSFRYAPAVGFAGSDHFRYRAGDGQTESEEVEVELHVTRQPVIVSEWMARNATTLTTRRRAVPDGPYVTDEEAPDWIELHNLLDQPFDVGGLHLTDSRGNLTKWRFPSPTWIEANAYLVVLASGEDVLDPRLDEHALLHAAFQLDGDGEYLALTDQDGRVIWQLAGGYPSQKVDVSYGLDEQGQGVYYREATPGSANGLGRQGVVDDVQFDRPHGFYDQRLSLTLSTPTAGAVIRYTIDGTEPTESNGFVYTEPLVIDSTQTVRATAFRDQWIESSVETNSYVFLDSVVRTAGIPEGYPAEWRRRPADYEMSQNETDLPKIAGDENLSVDAARNVIKQSLLALPTLSLVLDPELLFGSSRGIYVNPERRGLTWERAASVELLLPDGSPGFQIDAGLRIMGGTSRDLSLSPKQSFRLFFRSEYGEGRLEYPLFDDTNVTSFNTLILRANVRDSWVSSSLPAGPRSEATFIRDQWAKMAQAEMGQIATSGRFVHLYLNGIYWGIYNPTERPDAAFAAEHFGGEPSDYDVVKFCCPDEVVDGDRDEWDDLLARSTAGLSEDADYQFVQGNAASGEPAPEVPALIDVDNFIDYVINGQYHASVDWPGNYYAIRDRRDESTGFRFFTWDNDLAFPNLSTSANKVNTDPGHPWWRESPGVMDIALRRNAEYRMRFADHVQRHLFHDGSLTAERTAALWHQLADGLEVALIAESARWGDYRRDVAPSDGERVLYTVQDHWRPTVDRMAERYFPERVTALIRQLRARDLFPEIDAPEFLVDDRVQYGGVVAAGAALSITARGEAIYYTTDGSDPRLPGGAISPAALLASDPLFVTRNIWVNARTWNAQEWSALSEAEFVVGTEGDFDGNQVVDPADIALLCAAVHSPQADGRFDLTGDGQVDRRDHDDLIARILRTSAGDANLDRRFDSRDLVLVFQAGHYENPQFGVSTWAEGDWNCDGQFNSADLVAAFQAGQFVAEGLPRLVDTSIIDQLFESPRGV